MGQTAILKAGWGVHIGQDFYRAQSDEPVEIERDLSGGKVLVRLKVGRFAGHYGHAEQRGLATDSAFTVDIDMCNQLRRSVTFNSRPEALAYAARMANDAAVSWAAVRGLGCDAKDPLIEQMEKNRTAPDIIDVVFYGPQSVQADALSHVKDRIWAKAVTVKHVNGKFVAVGSGDIGKAITNLGVPSDFKGTKRGIRV